MPNVAAQPIRRVETTGIENMNDKAECTDIEAAPDSGGSAGEALLSGDLALLHHALGISNPLEPNKAPYRNHFVAGEGHADMPGLLRLVDAGLMEKMKGNVLTGGDYLFTVTESGQARALQTRPRAPKSKLRYHRFLDLKDVIPDLTFRDFLTDPQYREYRAT